MENQIKKGDIVGNTVNGFKFQVVEILYQFEGYTKMIVENISTFEKRETDSDNMYLHGTRKY